jgi:signal transduction histidine kinase
MLTVTATTKNLGKARSLTEAGRGRLASRYQTENDAFKAGFEALCTLSGLSCRGFARADSTGKCQFVSDGFLQALSLQNTEPGRIVWFDAIDQAQRESVRSQWDEALAKGERFDAEFRMAAGESWWRAIALPNQDSLITVLLLNQSSTEAPTRILDQAAELQQSRDELRQFAYVASHDLSEPLRMVASYSQLLVRRYASQIGPDGSEYIDFIQEAVSRMKLLLNDLVSYSRALNHVPRRCPFSSQALVHWVLMNLSREVQESGASVELGELPKVCADQDQILIVLEHLIANAIKYRSSDPLKIRIDSRMEGDWHIFSVQDNGIGVEPEFHGRIFEVFKRLHPKSVPGNGIGLAVSRKIIEAHGGRIWVESEAGRGSTFFFTLPAA